MTGRLLDANEVAERLDGNAPVEGLAVNRDEESRHLRGRDVEQPGSFVVGVLDPVGVIAHPCVAEFAGERGDIDTVQIEASDGHVSYLPRAARRQTADTWT